MRLEFFIISLFQRNAIRFILTWIFKGLASVIYLTTMSDFTCLHKMRRKYIHHNGDWVAKGLKRNLRSVTCQGSVFIIL